MKDNSKPRYGLEDNNAQVAEELGITEIGATYIKNNALKKAKAILEQRGFKSTDFFGEKDET
jgi:DNA-directed RNA polymerase specialized sigma subunit